MRKRWDAKGFTIVELLVVIVVIAILATITIVAFNGVVKRANDAALQTGLSDAARKIQSYNAMNDSYPSTTAAADVQPPNGVEVRYTATPATFCLIYTKAGISYSVTQQGQVSRGLCQAGLVTTLAGSGAEGYLDGGASTARFGGIDDLVRDSTGIIYVADSLNHVIRKITPSGDVSTLAGMQTDGSYSVDGTGSDARFADPRDIALDKDGNLYVADSNKLRKVTPSGVVTTVAGGASQGNVDGTGAVARFTSLVGVAIAPDGMIYAVDYGRIRKITPAGVVSTLAGNNLGFADGTGSAALFLLPDGITVDSSGIIYVADLGNYRIRKITPAGVVTTIAGSGESGFKDGIGAAAAFDGPTDVATDAAGMIYVSDGGNSSIRKVTPDGVVSTVAGTGITGYVDGGSDVARFTFPSSVTVDSSGVLYVSDKGNYRIRMIK